MTFSKALQEEIDFRFGLYCDAAIEDGEALPVLDDLTLELIFQDIENSDLWPEFKRELMDWFIEKGIYVEVPAKEMRFTVVLGGGGKAREFPRHRGKRYVFERHLRDAATGGGK